MQFAAILQLLSVLAPAFLATSTTFVKGNKRYIVAIAAYFILKRWALDAARQKSLSEIEGTEGYLNPNALATGYQQAMNPSGYIWAMSSDGTDEEVLYELAAKSRGKYKDVYNSYQKQFGRDLTTDLISELSTADYQRFLTILN